MKPDEIRRLLGGYATGTLTEEERKALFEAALEDQKLFDALAEEETLRDLLSDESFRSELASALEQKRLTLGERLASLWRRPLPLAVAGGLAAAAVAVVLIYQVNRPPEQIAEIALARKTAPEELRETWRESAAPLPAPPAAPSPEKKVSSQELPQAAPPAPMETGGQKPREKEEVQAQLAKDQPAEQPVMRSVKPAGEVPPSSPEKQTASSPARAKRAAAEAAAGERVRADVVETPSAAALRDIRVGTIAVSGRAEAGAEQTPAIPVRVERRQPDGSIEETGTEQPLGRDDVVRIAVRAPVSGQLYLLEMPPSEGSRLIFSSPVVKGTEYRVPTRPPAEPGPRKYLLVFSEAPLPLSAFQEQDEARAPAATTSREIVLTWR